jgi:tetratricopeptide (TPR) repeat protein
MLETTIRDRYKLTKSLGKGGFGEVFEAQDLSSDSLVVVKVGYISGTDQRKQHDLLYNREAITLLELRHENIVRLLDFGNEGTMHFMVMENDRGISLHHYLRGKEWPPVDEVVPLIIQVARALEYVHKRRIVHQDLKPSNLILRDGKIGHCKVVDFGCALLKRKTYQAAARSIMGTFPYISPEQLSADRTLVDARSDLYALGIMFYELLAGSQPYPPGTAPAEVREGRFRKVALPSLVNPLVPTVLDRIVMKLISHNLEARYQTADSLLGDLEEFREWSRQKKGTPFFRIGKMDLRRDVGFTVPFVGRDREISELRKRFDRAVRKKGALVLLAGQAGSGKTRLTEEFTEHARAKGGVCLQGKCGDTSEGFPYFPLIQIFQDYMEFLSTIPSLVAQDHFDVIRKFFSPFATEIADLAPTISRHLVPELGSGPTDPSVRLPQFLERIGKFFSEIGSTLQPLLLVFEDVHWADPGTFRVLEMLAGTLQKSPGVLALASYRPEELDQRPALQKFVEGLVSHAKVASFSVSPLTPGKVGKLVESILPKQIEGHRDLVQRLLDFSRGNPLFILEMIRQLIEEGAIIRSDDRWEIDRSRINQPAVAKSLIEIILARTDRLSEKTREILRTASCIGRSFSPQLLVALSTYSESEVEDGLSEAVSARLVEFRNKTGEIECTFTHDKIYETFYQDQNEDRKREFHLRIAEHLENAHRLEVHRFVYSLAYHYDRGSNGKKAFEYAMLAGEKALGSLALHQAAEFYNRALDLLREAEISDTAAVEIELREKLADACTIIGDYDRAIENYDLVMANSSGDQTLAALERKIGGVYFRRGAMPTAIDHFSSGLRYLRSGIASTGSGAVFAGLTYLVRLALFGWLPSSVLRLGRKKKIPTIIETVNLNHLTSFTLFWVDCVRSIELVVKNHYLCKIIGKSHQQAISYGQMGIVYSMKGFDRLARRSMAKGLRISEQVGSQLALGTNLYFQGLVYQWAGENLKAIETFRKALEIHGRIDAPFEANLDYTSISQCLRYLGRLDEACEMTLRHKELAEAVKDFRGIAGAHYHMADLFFYYGNLDDAKQSIELCFEYGDKQMNPLLYSIGKRVLGRIYVREGKIDGAIELLEESIKITKGKMFSGEYIVTHYIALGEACMLKIRSDSTLTQEQVKSLLARANHCLKFCEKNSKHFNNFLGPTLRLKAAIAEHLGKKETARQLYEQAVAILEKQGIRYEHAESLVQLARFLESTDPALSEDFRKKGYAILEELEGEGTEPTGRKTSSSLTPISQSSEKTSSQDSDAITDILDRDRTAEKTSGLE